jgi:hypothetical protein
MTITQRGFEIRADLAIAAYQGAEWAIVWTMIRTGG